MAKSPQGIENEAFSEPETVRRSEAALMRALSMPHKRQADMKIGKLKRESGEGASPKKRGRPAKTPKYRLGE
jgi:hypothetical protein